MATRTENFELYKPDATDNFSDFREEFNDNMEIIDQNLGGGGGGGGDVMDVEVNGVSVLDPDDKIAKITSYKEVTESEYEAIPVAERESNGVAYFIKDLNNASVQGYPPLIYSDEEREVGVFRDGKPLYQRTYDLGSDVSVSNSTWQSTGIDVSNVEMIPKCGALSADGSYQSDLLAWNNGGNLHIQTPRNSTGYARYLILQYTKTTDVAGSGIWNGQGGLAHHYSTNETVIGTWINGSPLYEKVYNIQARSSTISTSLLADLNIDVIVDCHIMIWDGSTYKRQELSYNSDTKLLSDIPSNKWISHISVQYTKTTD